MEFSLRIIFYSKASSSCSESQPQYQVDLTPTPHDSDGKVFAMSEEVTDWTTPEHQSGSMGPNQLDVLGKHWTLTWRTPRGDTSLFGFQDSRETSTLTLRVGAADSEEVIHQGRTSSVTNESDPSILL
ncbi:unnamed protein product [Allacma fusca]|uniref:Uncharacterized protein n=1 Tax=Allacma fusca TaxID=39272 RepID=A0A8J2K817_9HEXA|nr:unnamed protein product [Allacma fusca]